MLQLHNIRKTYTVGDLHQVALNDVSLCFRRSEFVSILGPSGSGKTTLLNIVGGLDQYDAGDLLIDGKSTKHFKDRDWDAYRNHTVGFVFQSYNLIPHQTVLANVELALTLSGVSKSERRRRAVEVLGRVGLSDHLHKRPNQLSGGQMQRVAIARALINDPQILLADEPTGALDSETSVQIMELLKEIAHDRLIIMVTHNPELAEQYSTRVIKLRDGSIMDDTDPYTPETAAEQLPAKEKHRSMSFFTALSLSLHNLMTKKTRTLLTAFAGSIGIIGIALILSLSNGVQLYIDQTESETLSNYPLTIDRQAIDYASMMANFQDFEANNGEEIDTSKAHTQDYLFRQLDSLATSTKTNDLKAFRAYIEKHRGELEQYTADIRYGYNTTLYVYNYDNPNQIVKANPNTLTDDVEIGKYMMDRLDSQASMYASAQDSDLFTELFVNETLQNNYYELLSGKMPEKYDEVVLLLDKNNRITDYSLYTLGLLDREELRRMLQEDDVQEPSYKDYDYDELIGQTFRVMAASDLYQKTETGAYVDQSTNAEYMKTALADALEIKVVGVAKFTEEASSVSALIGGMVGYLPSLNDYIMERNNNSDVVKAQQADKTIDVFTGFAFKTSADIEQAVADFDMATVPPQYQGFFVGLEGDDLTGAIRAYVTMTTPTTTYANNLETLGVASHDDPSSIAIYCKDFEAKDKVEAFIKAYNDDVSETQRISYTDYVGLMMSSVTTIIDAISYVLIAFVAISLVVSSIMIGIITYISVLERTKEIGILRSVGASKKDVSRVFNAETLIVGFVAGALGILITLLLIIPINAIILSLTDIANMAALPPMGGVLLVVISMVLTLIAGLIPSRVAAKKDPVEALRSE